MKDGEAEKNPLFPEALVWENSGAYRGVHLAWFVPEGATKGKLMRGLW